MRLLPAALAALSLLLLPAAAQAAPALTQIGTFSSPVYVTSPPGDSRVFVVEQGGRVRIVGRSEPFADLSAITLSGGERGLLSVAFAPDYAQSGLLYAYLTAKSPQGQIQIRELRRSGTDPNRAEAGAGRLVLAQDHADFPNHNGGQLQFGPDGLLYAGLGDGGSGNDPRGNAQRLTSLLGKLLRIDPRGSGDGQYRVPADNPFAGRTDARGEIWAYGLRNPFRFSFDRGSGDLLIGDVGQGAREEVDRGRASAGGGRGADYGWVCKEGFIDTPSIPDDRRCDPGADYVPPIYDRTHASGACSITGGYVVRDPGLPSLAGRYVHGDFCDPALRSFVPDDPSTDAPTGLKVEQLSSFGEDAAGHLYVASLKGPVYQVTEPPAPGPGGGNGGGGGAGGGTGGNGDGGTGAGGGADRTACRIALRRPRVQRPTKRRAVRLTVTTSERCTVRATLRLKGVATLRSRTRTLAAGRRSTLKIRLTGRAAAKLRRALARRSRRARITVVARDAAGNRSSEARRVRLRRPA